jgi:hypothetical protein
MREAEHEALVERSMSLRAEAWGRWGAVDGDLLTHLVNPALMGGPRWPAMRQAFRVARRESAVLVASDGLSDPFDAAGAPRVNGFGLEIFAWSPDPLGEVAGSWLWDMVWQMSQFAARHEGIGELLDELGVLTTELYDVRIPAERADRLVNEAGRVGVLVAPAQAPLPARIDGPLSPIRLVGLTLLTRAELAWVLEGGDAARTELAARLGRLADPQASSLARAPVV